MKRLQTLRYLSTFIAITAFFFAGLHDITVSATNTPQALPFSQNWTNVGLITTDDNWTGVPGIIGYRGDDLSTTIDVDLRTVLADGSATPVDVNANRSDPDVFATGGIAEFDGIPNPVVAFQGSATSDIPHLVLYLNTTGRSNIQITYNARDIDAGTGVDAVQQINTQFRVGGTGNYANVTGGYIADATSGVATATLVTPVSVALPAAANNQPLVEVRIMTTNAVGSDEFVGIDDIAVTGSAAVTADAPNDLNGDGKSDYVVVRNVGGGPTGQVRWFYNTNGTGAPTAAIDWGIATDVFLMEDYDGDNKDDITVWRGTDVGGSKFYIFNSATSTYRAEQFGLVGDNPRIAGDYDGDGKADLAVYRAGANAGDQSFWYYRGSLNNPSGAVTYVPWGKNGDFEVPGDYDGDGKFDFVIQRNAGGGQAGFWTLLANGTQLPLIYFGLTPDIVVPGDYDGDGKCDIASLGTSVLGGAGRFQWRYRSSISGSIVYLGFFGETATDFPVQGDYDGDGKVEPAIWRPNVDPTMNFFWSADSSTGATRVFELGQNGDYPAANWNRH